MIASDEETTSAAAAAFLGEKGEWVEDLDLIEVAWWVTTPTGRRVAAVGISRLGGEALVAVLSEYRGQGYGRRALACLLALAHHTGSRTKVPVDPCTPRAEATFGAPKVVDLGESVSRCGHSGADYRVQYGGESYWVSIYGGHYGVPVTASAYDAETCADCEVAREDVEATLHERGNGFPDVGDYVTGGDGEVYEVVEISGRIHTGPAGSGNYVYGLVRLADWSDVTDETEPVCSAVIASGGAS